MTMNDDGAFDWSADEEAPKEIEGTLAPDSVEPMPFEVLLEEPPQFDLTINHMAIPAMIADIPAIGIALFGLAAVIRAAALFAWALRCDPKSAHFHPQGFARIIRRNRGS